ncbi:putative glyoxalase superfamily protein PhnB [Roseivirga ehrenbergii]|uniref:Glyoxalase n=1 Tax=Roseivirga ehrenbergii (strain DSM 102268 / JCM 13514 / KCTC 12282 / NCIMB 14502 / KMM 6017) TaxID=279360 RepID=A0A150X0B1_ROSEK|nr:VOC family protein [Roseivirga ehrenbergii]KYG72164.1 glyoxalase [Roseivirga ehrenbergii]TCL13396.1 putative glyoxalase superfamily protein PhnB [Roseivirga ehrenbergii]
MKIPQGHQSVMPYLILPEAESFSEFAKQVFDAKVSLTRLREDEKTIMHSELIIGNSTIMFAGATEQFSPQTANLFVYVDNADETYKKALDNGASSVMGLSNQDYGRTCGVLDPFGNTWWITSVK